MAGLIRRLVAVVGTYGSMTALILSFRQPGTELSAGQLMLIASALLLGAASLALEIRDWWVLRPWIKRPTAVPGFLHDWIKNGGRVAVFSRNMSWVDDRIRSLLREKAEADDLTIVLPQHIELTEDLERRGAEILTYPELDYTIQSRFTIANLGRGDAKVAVGHALDSWKHRIDTVGAGHEPAFYMAQDLIELMRRFKVYRGRDE